MGGEREHILAEGTAGKGESLEDTIHMGEQKWQDKASPKLWMQEVISGLGPGG